MTICAYNDCYSQPNIVLEKAKEAVLISNAQVVVPQFKDASMNPTAYQQRIYFCRKFAMEAKIHEIHFSVQLLNEE
jgi:hypothetical protein